MESTAEAAVQPGRLRLVATVRSLLPRGGSLPGGEWQRRHKALLVILWINVVVLPLFGAVVEGYGLMHTAEHVGVLFFMALLAGSSRFSPMLRSVFCSIGLLTAAALLVHLTGGLIEAHFYFFVLVVALTLYESWIPFLVAVGYVLLHHGIVGTLAAERVYNRPEAWAEPWLWAGIHAFFVALAGIAGVIAWRLNENVRDKMREAQDQLATLAETDSLTNLSNRRRAMADLGAICADPRVPHAVALLDLDGFKAYNDTFGHPAGDALLARLGHRLEAMIGTRGSVYRLGGDEFCVIGPGEGERRGSLEASAAAALSETGQAFSITASYGSVLVPDEAQTPSDAMRIADQRMYARKNASRASAMNQSKDVLLRAMTERHPDLGGHSSEVRELVVTIAAELGVPIGEIETLRHAAELHDIGKVAIPDALLQKPGPLDEGEWAFIRRHTLIGQRIVAEAPALAKVGELVRSSHERWDGTGYPDGLKGEEIPLGSRIVAACDAYDAMTTDRPYRVSMPKADALAELRSCAGTQFDPRVVEVFEAKLAERQRTARVTPIRPAMQQAG